MTINIFKIKLLKLLIIGTALPREVLRNQMYNLTIPFKKFSHINSYSFCLHFKIKEYTNKKNSRYSSELGYISFS